MRADQHRRLHTVDPRLSYPLRPIEAARRALADDEDHLEQTWAVVAECAGRIVGYLRVWWRNYGEQDAQLMWMPAHHLTCELFFQFAAAEGLDAGQVFSALFAEVGRVAAAPPDASWVLSLVPPSAGLAPALGGLGFRLTSIFAHRPIRPQPAWPLPPGYLVRRATRDDLGAIADLYYDLCAYHEQNDPYADRVPPGLREDFAYVLRGALLEPRRWVLPVAVNLDAPAKPVAFALGSLDREEGGPAKLTQMPPGQLGFIYDFMVAAEHRGRGLGRGFWTATHNALADLGKPNATWLIYRPSNPTGGRFWPAVGYTPLYEMWRRGGW